MTLRIYKYPVPIVASFSLQIHPPARILSFQAKEYGCYVWAVVNPDKEPIAVNFRLFGTWEEIDEEVMDVLGYVGTCQNGPYVWHLFTISNTTTPVSSL